MKGCYLSIDFEDFCHDLQRGLGIERPTTRPQALQTAVERIDEILKSAGGSTKLTFFSTGQIARDYPEMLSKLANSGHEVGCHGNFHDLIYKMNPDSFARSLDTAVELIGNASGQAVNGFRAPNFSIRDEDDWAYEALAKRFVYDSSYVTDKRAYPENTTEHWVFGEHQLIEFPVYRKMILPKFTARVIGGTYLKLLPLKTVLNLMQSAENEGFLPLIYLHPYELLSDFEFWVWPKEMDKASLLKKMYWQVRQNQWLTVGNKNLVRKLRKILEVYPHRGTMISHLS